MFKVRGPAVVTACLLLAVPATAQTNSGGPIAGCVQKTGDVYTLTDDSSKATFQLRGGHLKAGQHVQVVGTPVANATPASGVSQVFDVTSVTRTSQSCPGSRGGGLHLSRAHVISIGIVGGLVVFGIVKAAGRIGPSF
jgi:hypothetical protein